MPYGGDEGQVSIESLLCIVIILCLMEMRLLAEANSPMMLFNPLQVLALDASSVEAIACLASHSFYTDQPEIALRYYRRLLQMGVSNAEIWNNLGLCCFYASQYDMCLSCFERALSMADDSSLPDVWYNIGQVGDDPYNTGCG